MISFNTILLDPVISALRREQLRKHGSQMSDDEPLYDSVASDDDYAFFATDTASRLSTTIISENEVRKNIVIINQGFKKFEIVLWKRIRIRLCGDSSPGLCLSYREVGKNLGILFKIGNFFI